MKFGVHSFLFTESWSDAQLPLLDRVRELGLDLFEIAIGDGVVFTPALTRRYAAEAGLALAVSPGGGWPVECDLSADDPEQRALGLAWHQRQVDVAAELGAIAYSGALYGHPGVVKRRIPPKGEAEWTAGGLQALAAYGAERGVEIVLEPMSHFRTHLVNTPEQVMHLVSLAGHPNLRVLLDTYHLVTEVRDYAAAVQTVAPRLWGLHACENDRGVPGGGLVPWHAIFRTLQELSFEGYLVMETYNSVAGDPPGAFAYSRGMFHNVCPDPDAFVRQGLSFLRSFADAASNGLRPE